MLRIVSAIIFLALFLLFVVFWMENYVAFTTPVEIRYNILFFKVEPIEIRVWALMIFTFAVGVILTFFLEMIGWFKNRSKMVSQNRKIKNMEKELQGYRTGSSASSSKGDSSADAS